MNGLPHDHIADLKKSPQANSLMSSDIEKLNSDKKAMREAVKTKFEQERAGFAQPEIESSISSEEILKALEDNEDGDARLFQTLNRGRLVYDCATDTWYTWTGTYWKEDFVNQAMADIQGVIEEYGREAQVQSFARVRAEKTGNREGATQHELVEKALLKRIRALQSLKRKKDVLHLAHVGADSLAISGNEWDQDPWLLACFNGVINLKSGLFQQGKPENYLKTVAPVEWLGIDEPCPQWERFINDIFGNDLEFVNYIQRFLGYGITGLTTLHKVIFLWGLGRNGKGTLLEMLKYVLGPLAYKTESEILLAQKFSRQGGSSNTAILQLRGKRIVWASETNDGRRLDAARLKELVGGDTLNARPLYGKSHIEFKPTHLLLLLTNSKPQAPANDYALWQRIALVPFTLSFVENPTKPNERQADPNLMEKLKAEASGILAWLVRGCLQWQKAGLNVPEAVRSATEEYREDEDLITQFIADRCVAGDTMQAKAGELYKAYKVWCSDQGQYPMSGKRFGTNISNLYDAYKNSTGKYYLGIGLMDDGCDLYGG